MLTVKDLLITGDVYSSRKLVELSTKDCSLKTIDQDIVVFRKGEHHIKRSAEVGDGMDLVVVHKRPFISYALEKESFGQGLGIYEEFDENAGLLMTYLYRFPKDGIQDLNELLKRNKMESQISVEGRFVVVDRNDKQSDPMQLKTMLMHGGFGSVLSFLYGLFCGYGRYVGDSDSIHYGLISIPVLGSIAQYENLFERIETLCQNHGVYLRFEYRNQSGYQLLDIGVHDWEVLKHFFGWSYDNTDGLRLTKYEQMNSLKAELKEFLLTQKAGKGVTDQLGVVKRLKI